MDHDDIIRMAREAGWNDDDCIDIGVFVALIKEQMLSEGWRQCAVGQRTTQFCGQVQAAVALEREEILKMSEAQWFRTQADYDAAIRARGEA